MIKNKRYIWNIASVYLKWSMCGVRDKQRKQKFVSAEQKICPLNFKKFFRKNIRNEVKFLEQPFLRTLVNGWLWANFKLFKILSIADPLFTPIMASVHKMVKHTFQNLAANAARFLTCVWPFHGHYALKWQDKRYQVQDDICK